MFKKNFRFILLSVLMTVPAVAFGQSAVDVIESANETLVGLSASLVRFASITLGVIGAIMLTLGYFKYSKGDPSAAGSLAKVGGGLLIAVIILEIIRFAFLGV